MSQVALVTGASSGIGKATALQLLDDGYTVYAGARRVERMQDLADRGAHVEHLDVSDDESIQSFVAKAVAEQERVDVLISNAGYGLLGALEDVPMAEARRQFEVNVFGAMRTIQLVAPHMRQQREGRIVIMSSVSGKSYLPIAGWYHVTKHALEALGDTLRIELEPFGVKVIVMEPGAVKTEWLDVARDSAQTYSGAGDYADVTRTMTEVFDNAFDASFATPPADVAKLVSKSLHASKPKTRYLIGKMIRLPLFMKKHLSDRVYQKSIEMHLKRMGLKA